MTQRRPAGRRGDAAPARARQRMGRYVGCARDVWTHVTVDISQAISKQSHDGKGAMSPVTHQTVTLSKGKHATPEDGACVMELASMLAGEPFTDHPASACPVIASFLRAYNDSIDDDRRQDLYAYAATVVGSRASIGVQRARVERLAEWAFDMQRRHWTSRYVPMARLRMSSLRRQPSAHAIGTYAVRTIPRHTDETHAEALALLEELLAVGAPPQRAFVRSAAEALPSALFPVG